LKKLSVQELEVFKFGQRPSFFDVKERKIPGVPNVGVMHESWQDALMVIMMITLLNTR